MKKVLYFIGCNEYAVKIGFTEDIYKRLKQLQTGNPYELKLLHLIDNISPQLESFVHDFFESAHIKNEWYDHSDTSHIISQLKKGHSMQTIILNYDPLLYESFVYNNKNSKMPWWYSKIKDLPEEEQYDHEVETAYEYIARMLEKWNKEHVSVF